METVHLTITNRWLVRALGHNPLVRGSDRAEAVITALLAIVLILFIPVAGAVGTSVHDSQMTYLTNAQATRHQVTAEISGDSTAPIDPYETGSLTPLRWTVDGQVHETVVRTEDERVRGGVMTIWVDDRGERVPAPPTPDDAALAAVVAAVSVWVGAAAVTAAVLGLLRHQLNRRRYAAWERAFHDVVGGDGERPQRW